MENGNDQKIIDIVITDIQLHVVKPRKPASADRAIGKSIKNKKAGRFYKRDISVTKNGKIELPIIESSEMIKIREKYKKEGKTVRFFIPKEGLNVYAGKDTLEHMEAKERKAS